VSDTPRSYADPCAVARALDAVGERWALLVVRELSLGPRRFGQLRAGLPGISPNVLSQRLRELEDAGVLRRYEMAAPASGAAYELTERGYALDPVLQALGRWGASRPVVGDRPLSVIAFVRSLRVLLDPDAPNTRLCLEVAGEPFGFEVTGGRVDVHRGRPVNPVVTLAGDVATLARALLSDTPLTDLAGSGALSVDGEWAVAERLRTLFRRPPRQDGLTR